MDFRPKQSDSWFKPERIKQLEQEHLRALAEWRRKRLRLAALGQADSDSDDAPNRAGAVGGVNPAVVTAIIDAAAHFRSRRIATLQLRHDAKRGLQRDWVDVAVAAHDWTETGWSTTEWAEMDGYMTVAVDPAGERRAAVDPFYKLRECVEKNGGPCFDRRGTASVDVPNADAIAAAVGRRALRRLYRTGPTPSRHELEELAVVDTPRAPLRPDVPRWPPSPPEGP